MMTRLMRTSCALALPLALALVSQGAVAAVQQDRNESSGKESTKPVTTTKDGTDVKKPKRHSRAVAESATASHEAMHTGSNGAPKVALSVRDWHPELAAGNSTQTTAETTTRTTARPTSTRRSLRGTGSTPRERAEEVK